MNKNYIRKAVVNRLKREDGLKIKLRILSRLVTPVLLGFALHQNAVGYLCSISFLENLENGVTKVEDYFY